MWIIGCSIIWISSKFAYKPWIIFLFFRNSTQILNFLWKIFTPEIMSSGQNWVGFGRLMHAEFAFVVGLNSLVIFSWMAEKSAERKMNVMTEISNQSDPVFCLFRFVRPPLNRICLYSDCPLLNVRHKNISYKRKWNNEYQECKEGAAIKFTRGKGTKRPLRLSAARSLVSEESQPSASNRFEVPYYFLTKW